MSTEVKATPPSKTVVALNDVTLTCTPITATYVPDEYSWHRVDGVVPSYSSGQNSNKLTIHRILPADEGQYYCVASLFGHCAKSNTVTVIVGGKVMVPTMYSTFHKHTP